MCAIAAALVLAQTVLSEPAMQHVGIDAMFTRCGGNRCAGLLARGDQFSLELRAVDAALAQARVVRIGSFLRHGVHDGLRGHDGACNGSFRVDGFAGRILSESHVCRVRSRHKRLGQSTAAREAIQVKRGLIFVPSDAETEHLVAYLAVRRGFLAVRWASACSRRFVASTSSGSLRSLSPGSKNHPLMQLRSRTAI